MARKSLAWFEIAGAALAGGLGYVTVRARMSARDQIQVGDDVVVKISDLTVGDAAQGISLASLASSPSSPTANVRVTDLIVARPHFWQPLAGAVQGLVGQVPVVFKLSDVQAITRNGRLIT